MSDYTVSRLVGDLRADIAVYGDGRATAGDEIGSYVDGYEQGAIDALSTDDLGSVEYVVVANDLLLALIREVERLRVTVDALPFTLAAPTSGDAYEEIETETLKQLAERLGPMRIVRPEPEPQPEVEPAALSEVDQARREAAAEEAAFRAQIAQEPVEGDGIIDTSTWPVHELGDTGGFR